MCEVVMGRAFIRFDCGPVLLQRKHIIVPSVTTELLSDQLADLGSNMVCVCTLYVIKTIMIALFIVM